jgi:hypothetical protein
MKRRVAAGVAIAALYVAVAQLSFHGGLLPVRPLYDGSTPPPPYHWVNPPPELTAGNVKPTSGTGAMTITGAHSPAYNLNTDDGQASLIFPPDGIVHKAGETKINISITPLDPVTIGSPPVGLDYDGNAYSITATYAVSGKPAEIPQVKCDLNNANACATVVLRYAFNATGLYLRDGQTWTKITSQTAGAALQIYGVTSKLGTFVAVGPHVVSKKPKGQTSNLIAFIIGLAAILAGTFLARVRAVRRRRARTAGREKGKRSKPQRTTKEQRRQDREGEEQKPWWRD